MFGNDLPGAPDERELIALFRGLTPALQRVVLNTLWGLLEAQGSSLGDCEPEGGSRRDSG